MAATTTMRTMAEMAAADDAAVASPEPLPVAVLERFFLPPRDRTLELLGQRRCRQCGTRVRKDRGTMTKHVLSHGHLDDHTSRTSTTKTRTTTASLGIHERGVHHRDQVTEQSPDVTTALSPHKSRPSTARRPLSRLDKENVEIVLPRTTASPHRFKSITPVPSQRHRKRMLEASTMISPAVDQPRKKKKRKNPVAPEPCPVILDGPTSSSRVARGSKDCATHHPQPSPPPTQQVNVPELIKDLAVACLMENVPPAFLSSPWFRRALLRHTGAAVPVDATAQAMESFRHIRSAVDEDIATIQSGNEGPVTLVVASTVAAQATNAPTYLSFYVVTSHGHCALLTTTPASPGSEWFDAIRTTYNDLMRKCPDSSVHVCVVGFPAFLVQQLPATIQMGGPSMNSVTLVGGCMTTEASWLACGLLELIPDFFKIITNAAEIAHLVNEVESTESSGPKERLQIAIPKLRSRQELLSLVLMLTNLMVEKSKMFARWSCLVSGKFGNNHRQRSHLRDLLQQSEGGAFWPNCAEIVRLLVPFVTIEALQTSGQGNPFVSSGVVFAAEFWALQRVQSSSVLNSELKLGWCRRYVELVRVRRWKHQLVALLLDPRLTCVGLSNRGRRSVGSWLSRFLSSSLESSVGLLETYKTQLRCQVAEFLARSGVFADPASWTRNRTSDPTVFWKHIHGARELRAVALHVLGYAPNSPPTFDSLRVLSDEISTESTLTAIGRLKHQVFQTESRPHPGLASLRWIQSRANHCTQDRYSMFNEEETKLDDIGDFVAGDLESHEGAIDTYVKSLEIFVQRTSRVASACSNGNTNHDTGGLGRFSEEWLDGSDNIEEQLEQTLMSLLN